MSTSIEKSFATRASAELAVERLVQEFGIERTDVFVSSAGDENSAGDQPSGGDAPAPLEEGRSDGALTGAITVSVDVNDDSKVEAIRSALDDVAAN
ncbi:hypothetical protein GR702_16855 [Novosphingobium sp. FGD1]|uniref:Uncharacterized protein n=1 Tax=Novosphingobium silvae TaxID=2692619 RepID=A0A7X4K7U1_9SPHN|nr:hypothetical protein [Novosphingobium silvae]MYL99441.1 hypothetical protein [Novosphingobium silvae]